MSALKNKEGHIAILVCKSAFLSPPISLLNKLIVTPRVAHEIVTKGMINKTLMTQSTSKVPEPDKFNFQILRMVLG